MSSPNMRKMMFAVLVRLAQRKPANISTARCEVPVLKSRTSSILFETVRAGGWGLKEGGLSDALLIQSNRTRRKCRALPGISHLFL